MKTVFIGGSRSISRLNPAIRAKLKSVIRKKYKILIGDANGADKAVQKYLHEMNYRNVMVFCMGQSRNNLGDWPTRFIRSDDAAQGFAYYSRKDMLMGDESDCGLMLWDGKSKGTLRNIQHLVRQGKTVLVYLSPEREFHVLEDTDELRPFLAHRSPASLRRLEDDDSSNRKSGRSQPLLDF